MFKAIIFDFGRVISAQKTAQLFHSYESDLGLEEGTINQIMFDSPLWEQALLGEISMSAYWQGIGSALNLHSSAAITSFKKHYYEDERINMDVLSLLRKLYGRYKLAILSNHPAGLLDWLVAWKIAELFEVIVCSGDEGVVKPDPRAYEITLQRLDVEPPQAIFIDDTPGHVEAAEALGISGIVFTDVSTLHRRLSMLIGDQGDGNVISRPTVS